MDKPLVCFENVSATVKLAKNQVLTTVNNVSLSFGRGTSYAVVGKSGSGKTSLISIMGLLNTDFTGTYTYDGLDVSTLGDRARSRLRAEKIGFVFQNYSLIRHLNVHENIDLALRYSGQSFSRRERNQRVAAVLNSVGLERRATDYPRKLSGGEQQRVAIARALVTDPQLLICDEPTGALDTNTGLAVLETLLGLVESLHTTLVLVTHDKDIAARCCSVVSMEAGRVLP